MNISGVDTVSLAADTFPAHAETDVTIPEKTAP